MAIIIAGLGFAREERPPRLSELLSAAGLLVAGRDTLARVEKEFYPLGARRLALGKDLDACFGEIWAAHMAGQSALILASGDPLFFGAAASLRRWAETVHGPEALEALTVIPNISSLQVMAARLALPWENLPCLSLHGREDYFPLWQALACTRHRHICLLTDPKNSPARVADALLRRGLTTARLHIFSRLGAEDETYFNLSLEEARNFDAPQPNALILEQETMPPQPLILGRDDVSFLSEAGLLTKATARAAAIAALRLEAGHTLWDLGAGSGSVSLEAAALLPFGRVFAVERLPARAEMIFANRRNCGAWQVEIVEGESPACLADLPDPDRIFIGGGIKESLPAACARLKPGGRLIINCVLQSSLQSALDHLTGLGWPVESVLLQASQGEPLGESFHFTAQNPVFILAAEKPAQ